MWNIGLALALAISSTIADEKCGVSKPPVLGGVSEKDVFPWVALLYFSQDASDVPSSLAMGTLVDSKHIVVPAHTTTHLNQILRYVQFGTTALNDTGASQNFDVEKVIVHPDFKKAGRRSQAQDIAIFRLAKPVSDIVPACLPEKEKSYDADHYYFMSYNSGGDPKNNQNARSHKYVSKLPRINTEDCSKAYQKYSGHRNTYDFRNNTASFTCAGDAENDSCIGDAGSPLLLQNGDTWTAVAFSSFGPVACRGGIPSVFLNIQPHVDWIKSVISEV